MSLRIEVSRRGFLGCTLAVALVPLASGCLVGVTDASEGPLVVSLSLQPGVLTLMPGEEQEMTVQVGWSDGRSELDPPGLSWSSSAPEIASVSDEGIVSAHVEGFAEVSVALGNLSVAARVSVVGETS